MAQVHSAEQLDDAIRVRALEEEFPKIWNDENSKREEAVNVYKVPLWFRGGHVWVKNATTEDVRLTVTRKVVIDKQLMEAAGNVGASASGGNIGGRVEVAGQGQPEDYVCIDEIAAGDETRLYLGSLTSYAFITAASKKQPYMVYCINRGIRANQKVIIRGSPTHVTIERKAVSLGKHWEAANRSPTHPEQWSPEEQDEAARDISAEYHQAIDAILNFMRDCRARNVHYADAFLSGDMTAEMYQKVDAARGYLGGFWKNVRNFYQGGKLTTDGGDFFAPKNPWFREGNAYRQLVEPLDIANWYKACNHLKASGGHYLDHVNELEELPKRPSQYVFLDQLMKDAGGRYDYSLDKAEEYKREAEAGNLQIQKLTDARADPPRGFKQIRPLRSDPTIQEYTPPSRAFQIEPSQNPLVPEALLPKALVPTVKVPEESPTVPDKSHQKLSEHDRTSQPQQGQETRGQLDWRQVEDLRLKCRGIVMGGINEEGLVELRFSDRQSMAAAIGVGLEGALVRIDGSKVQVFASADQEAGTSSPETPWWENVSCSSRPVLSPPMEPTVDQEVQPLAPEASAVLIGVGAKNAVIEEAVVQALRVDCELPPIVKYLKDCIESRPHQGLRSEPSDEVVHGRPLLSGAPGGQYPSDDTGKGSEGDSGFMGSKGGPSFELNRAALGGLDLQGNNSGNVPDHGGAGDAAGSYIGNLKRKQDAVVETFSDSKVPPLRALERARKEHVRSDKDDSAGLGTQVLAQQVPLSEPGGSYLVGGFSSGGTSGGENSGGGQGQEDMGHDPDGGHNREPGENNPGPPGGGGGGELLGSPGGNDRGDEAKECHVDVYFPSTAPAYRKRQPHFDIPEGQIEPTLKLVFRRDGRGPAELKTLKTKACVRFYALKNPPQAPWAVTELGTRLRFDPIRPGSTSLPRKLFDAEIYASEEAEDVKRGIGKNKETSGEAGGGLEVDASIPKFVTLKATAAGKMGKKVTDLSTLDRTIKVKSFVDKGSTLYVKQVAQDSLELHVVAYRPGNIPKLSAYEERYREMGVSWRIAGADMDQVAKWDFSATRKVEDEQSGEKSGEQRYECSLLINHAFSHLQSTPLERPLTVHPQLGQLCLDLSDLVQATPPAAPERVPLPAALVV